MLDSVAPLELIWSMKSRQTVCKHASSVVRDCKRKIVYIITYCRYAKDKNKTALSGINENNIFHSYCIIKNKYFTILTMKTRFNKISDFEQWSEVE